MRIPRDIEAAIDVAGEIRPVYIGRRRVGRAVDRNRQMPAIAGEGAAEISDQRVAFPVRDREKLRRDHIDRQSTRLKGTAGIGIVAAGELDRRLDQETAGVIADRTERIVVELEPLARRLACDRAGHRRRQRRFVGALRRRDRQPQLSAGVDRWRRAGTGRRLWPGLTRIELRLLALAVERIVAGILGAAGGGQAVSWHPADPRWRRPVALAVAGIAFRVAGIAGCLGVRGLAERRILRRDEAAADRVEQVGRDGLGLRGCRIERDQRKAWQQRAQYGCALFAALAWTRRHD